MNYKLKCSVILCGTMLFTAASAQKIVKNSNGIRVDAASGKLATEVVFYSPTVVRVEKYPSSLNSIPQRKSYSVTATPDKNTHIVIADYEGKASVSSNNITVVINKTSGDVTFTTPNGSLLLAEGKEHNADVITTGPNKGLYAISQTWILDPKESIFGLGQRRDTAMNQRGQHVEMWNFNTHIYMPYFTSQKGYGLYWDNAGRTWFDDDKAQGTTSFRSSVAPSGIDYYFIYKDGTQDGVIAGIRQLTGQATMFPLWTMGYWQSRERYKSVDEVCGVLDEYRKRQVPLDAIVQDWQYWGTDSNWNAMEFVAKGYEEPQRMVDHVHKNNAHIMITIWPDFGPWTNQYKEFSKMNALYPFVSWPKRSGARVYDAFSAKARDIYWRYLSALQKMGFDAWWTDSTEPDQFSYKNGDEVLTADGTWTAVHNAFSLVTNKGIYDHERAVKGNSKRAFHMTRSGAFGIQHYGTFSWSGDINSTWEEMRQQVPSGLNYVLCGIPFWNTDLGGFFGRAIGNNPKSPYAQELQVRWMQWGTFMPLMRNHCSSPMVSEIYKYGEPGDWAYDEQKKAIELRYRLLPYIYSQAGATVQKSDLMVRPLVMDFANDTTAINLNDEYLFGRSLLVKPVTKPLYTYIDKDRKGHLIYPDIEKASAPIDVYLPKGFAWFNFWTNEKQNGGQYVQTAAPISQTPVYVRAGSIVPFGPAVQYSNEKKWNNLEIRIYPGADADYTLYEDEGDTYNYEKGQFSQIRMHWNDAAHELTIDNRKGSFKGMLAKRQFRLLVVDDTAESGDREPSSFTKTIDYDGNSINVKL